MAYIDALTPAIVRVVKEIIWVYGTSASGKETFTKRLLRDEEIKRGIGIGGQTTGYGGL